MTHAPIPTRIAAPEAAITDTIEIRHTGGGGTEVRVPASLASAIRLAGFTRVETLYFAGGPVAISCPSRARVDAQPDGTWLIQPEASARA